MVGSVHTYVDVPDFDGGALTLSGLVLLDRRAPTTTPLDSLERLPRHRADDSAGVPRRRQVSAFARVYQKTGAPPTAATAVFRVLNAGLKEISSTRIDLRPTSLRRWIR